MYIKEAENPKSIEEKGDGLNRAIQEPTSLDQRIDNVESAISNLTMEIHNLKTEIQSSPTRKIRKRRRAQQKIYTEEQFILMPMFTCQYLLEKLKNKEFHSSILMIFLYCFDELKLGDKNCIYIERGNLREKTGLHRETVLNGLNTLEKCGLLIRVHGKTNQWQINPEAAWKGNADAKKNEFQKLRLNKPDFLESDFIKKKREWCQQENIDDAYLNPPPIELTNRQSIPPSEPLDTEMWSPPTP